jgi:hypothetical protein
MSIVHLDTLGIIHDCKDIAVIESNQIKTPDKQGAKGSIFYLLASK